MSYKWQFTTDEESPEGYYQKLVNMNLAETLSLEDAAERLNELELKLKQANKIIKNNMGSSLDEILKWEQE